METYLPLMQLENNLSALFSYDWLIKVFLNHIILIMANQNIVSPLVTDATY